MLHIDPLKPKASVVIEIHGFQELSITFARAVVEIAVIQQLESLCRSYGFEIDNILQENSYEITITPNFEVYQVADYLQEVFAHFQMSSVTQEGEGVRNRKAMGSVEPERKTSK